MQRKNYENAADWFGASHLTEFISMKIGRRLERAGPKKYKQQWERQYKTATTDRD